MSKTTDTIVADLSLAITSILSGDEGEATRATARALRQMTGGGARAVTHASHPVIGAKRGAKPKLTEEQTRVLVERVNNKEKITEVIKDMNLGVSYGTVHRYLRKAKLVGVSEIVE